jgi:hypothetical protein
VPDGAELVLQDVLTLDGRQLKDAACIFASPPCQRYSYMAMPWSRAKREASWQRWMRDSPFSPGFRLNDLFNACFRIQREASEAAGHHIPLVVENVCGAQPWVGPARAMAGRLRFGQTLRAGRRAKITGTGSWFFAKDNPDAFCWRKNGHAPLGLVNTESGHGQNPVNGVKDRDVDGYSRNHPEAFGWKMPRTSSHSVARKAASAQIAEIPYALSEYIARAFFPNP